MSSSDDEPNTYIPPLASQNKNMHPPAKAQNIATPLESPLKILPSPLSTPLYKLGEEGPIFLCLHGLGLSSQSFAPLSKYISFATLITFDFPQHYQNSSTTPLSLKNMVDLTLEIIDYLLSKFQQSIIIVGHSMGGSVAVHAANLRQEQIKGLIVIDVVEGTAIQALDFMEDMAKNRKQTFKDEQEAIQWYLGSKMVRNRESVRMCTSSQLKLENGEFTWRVNLLESQQYWRGTFFKIEWFTGLTETFLNVRIPKLLMVAEKERMDKELTIAQMQGKFQLSILYNVGHYMQEDDPKNTAKQLHNFIKVFKIPQNKKEQDLLIEQGVGFFKPDVKPFE